jgi:peptidoglycan/xylan/chitin deacetylase (PgdA/CDA1 family)
MNLKYLPLVVLLSASFGTVFAQTVTTTITEWQNGKNGAVSLTYDDASRHQFTRALPIMERLKLPATFFVITGPITGSQYHGKFIGRPVAEIIKESATIRQTIKTFWSAARPRDI